MSARLFLWLPLAILFAILHALPFIPRRDRLFGATVPREIRCGAEGRQALRRYELQLLPWTAAVLLASLWLPFDQAVMWTALGSLIPVIAAGWIFSRRYAEVRPFALPTPSTREAPLTDADEPVVGPMLLFVVPLFILAGTALYLHAHWDRIPARFPIHWGPGGIPNGWSMRSFGGVYGPLLLGALIILFLVGIFAITVWGSRRSARQPAAQIVLIAVAFVIATSFSLAGLLPLHFVRPLELLGWNVAALGLAAVMLWLLFPRRAEQGAPAAEITPDACWHGGEFYYNAQDPALFVEKRSGLGLTLNFGNRMSWIVLAVMLLIPAGLVLLAFQFTKR